MKPWKEDGLSHCPCDNCRHCERSEKKEECSNLPNPVKDDSKRNKTNDDEYHYATAARTAKHLVPKGQDGSTSESSWLVTLSNMEIREEQLRDPCLGAIIRLKEKSGECLLWETISRESLTFKCYWAQ